MRNRWQFVGVHVALAVVLVLLMDFYSSPGTGSPVAQSFAIIGIRMTASMVMPFLAGLITWAIFGRTNDPPALGFGLRYTALSVVATLLIWAASRLSLVLTQFGGVDFMLWIYIVVYVTPVLIVAAALLSLRRWTLPAIRRI